MQTYTEREKELLRVAVRKCVNQDQKVRLLQKRLNVLPRLPRNGSRNGYPKEGQSPCQSYRQWQASVIRAEGSADWQEGKCETA